MKISVLGKLILDFLNSERFLDWAFTSIFGFALWWAGYIDLRKQRTISAPRWLTILYRNRQGSELVYLRGFVMQMMGILLLLWNLILAFAIADHKQRIDLFGGGFVILGALGLLFIVIWQLISKR